MKILYILDFFYPHVGGVPTLFLNLCREMVKRGHDATVITTQSGLTKKRENYKGIKIFRVGQNREEFLWKASWHLLLSREKFDLIHTSTYSAMIPSFVATLFKHIPVVVNVHEIWSLKEMLEFYKAKGLLYFLEQSILLLLPFSVYVAPSLHTKKDLVDHSLTKKKIFLIRHGIDNNLFNPKIKKFRRQVRTHLDISDSEIVAIFIAKPTVFKGTKYLLAAIKKIRSSKKLRFIFVLSPLYQTEYKDLLKKISANKILKERIIIAKHQEEHSFIAKLIGASDFVVVPSLSEGFGFAAAEASSVGIPSIVTKGTSLTEVIENRKHGLYINMRDSDDLAKAIEKLTENENLRRKLSKRKNFKNWSEVVKEYEKLYVNLLSKHKEVR